MDNNIFNIIEEVAMESGFNKDGITDRVLQWIMRNVFRKNRGEDFIRSFIDDKTYKSYTLFYNDDHGYKSPKDITATSATFHYDPSTFKLLAGLIRKLMICLGDIYPELKQDLTTNTKQAVILLAMLASLYGQTYGDLDKVMRRVEPLNLDLFNKNIDEIIKALDKKEIKYNSNAEIIAYLNDTQVMKTVGNSMNAWYIWVLCDPHMGGDIAMNRSDKDIGHLVDYSIDCFNQTKNKLKELLKKYNEFLNTMAEDIRKL